MKWGEYSSDVQFILQRSEQQKIDPKQATTQNLKSEEIPGTTTTSSSPATTTTTSATAISIQPLERNKENRKSFGSHDVKPSEIVGIVKGIPQILPTLHQYHQSPQPPPTMTSSSLSPHHSRNNSVTSNENPNSSTNNATTTTTTTTTPPKPNEFNSADVRNSLDRKTNLFRDTSSNESLIDVYSTTPVRNELYKTTGPTISSNGALVPPPYRDPPPPRVSPLHQKSDSFSKMFEYKVRRRWRDRERFFFYF